MERATRSEARTRLHRDRPLSGSGISPAHRCRFRAHTTVVFFTKGQIPHAQSMKMHALNVRVVVVFAPQTARIEHADYEILKANDAGFYDKLFAAR